MNETATAESAASVLQQWQVGSCPYGFSGWLLWTWDLPASPNNNFWPALSGNGGINSAIEPAVRPNACQAGAYPGQNIAFGAQTSASNTWSGTSPGSGGPPLAVDGNVNTFWNSGGPPPQWIEIAIPSPSIVSGVKLTVSQSPSGPTVHDLYVRIQGGQLQLVNEFSGTTQDMLVLNWSPSQSLVGVTSIRVMTTASPSWVGWREIEILSGDTSEPAITSAVNGASFDASITPGSWVTIQGSGLAASERTWQSSDFNGTQLPISLDGVSVSIDGAPAPVYYISPTQLNVQAPSSIHIGQLVPISVARTNIQVTGAATVQSKLDDPALFAYTAAGSLYAAAVFLDGTIVGDPTKTPGTRAAKPGDEISLYGTAFGPSPSGSVISSPTTLLSPVVVTVGGQPAVVQYAGLVGVGLYQINIVVPSLAIGDFPVAIQFQGASAASTPSIPIR